MDDRWGRSPVAPPPRASILQSWFSLRAYMPQFHFLAPAGGYPTSTPLRVLLLLLPSLPLKTPARTSSFSLLLVLLLLLTPSHSFSCRNLKRGSALHSFTLRQSHSFSKPTFARTKNTPTPTTQSNGFCQVYRFRRPC